jgi:uncharacterized protein (DUF1697 family)
MPHRYVALLRAITNVEMKPFRDRMERLGFADVASYGMSGNLLFNAVGSDIASLESRIAAEFDTVALVRTRPELARIVGQDPFGSTILFLARASTTARREFLRLDFEPPGPVLRGKTVYFEHPAKLRGKSTPFDFERALGVQGTARSARVVRALLERMSAA